MNKISKREIEELIQKVLDIHQSLDIDSKSEILLSLENESRKENLWDDNKHAQDVMSLVHFLENLVLERVGLLLLPQF